MDVMIRLALQNWTNETGLEIEY